MRSARKQETYWYMSLIACGSIHEGHKRFILVMTLEENKRFLCVWVLYYVSKFCRFANGGAKIGQDSSWR